MSRCLTLPPCRPPPSLRPCVAARTVGADGAAPVTSSTSSHAIHVAAASCAAAVVGSDVRTGWQRTACAWRRAASFQCDGWRGGSRPETSQLADGMAEAPDKWERAWAWRRFGSAHDKPCKNPSVVTCAMWECQQANECRLGETRGRRLAIRARRSHAALQNST